jgi:TonB family protein
MILWMVYSLLVAVLLSLAAHGSERVLRLNGRATRWVWLGALLLSFGLPALLPWLTRLTASDGAGLLVPSTATVSFAIPPLVAGASPAFSMGRVLQVGWLGASIVLALYGVWSLWRLSRARRSWRPANLLSHDVLISQDLGPAVIGVIDPAIVLPEWVSTLETRDQALVLAHESAHIAARDPWLVRLSQVAPLLMPWNAALWLQARRLRECVELDCDARLLAAGESADGYAELLLSVGERATRVMLAAGMAEPRSLLERRIMRIFEAKPRRTLLRVTAWLAVAVVALFAAFNAPLPAKSAARSSQLEQQTVRPGKQLQGQQPPGQRPQGQQPQGQQPQGQQPQGQQQQQQQQEPTFTPFTEPPVVLNEAEVARAIEAYFPPLLRDAGVGGAVRLWFYVNDRGELVHVRVAKGSGHQALDDAALKVAELIRFTPAKNRDRAVAVWVDMPIVFGEKSVDITRPAPQQSQERQQQEQGPTFTPFTVAPLLLNAREVSQALQRFYPPLLRDSNVGGSVKLWFYIAEEGNVRRTLLKSGSGHAALDDAAMKVAEMMRFAPAKNRDKLVPVWVDIPIVFRPGRLPKDTAAALTPEQAARLAEFRRADNKVMSELAKRDQEARTGPLRSRAELRSQTAKDTAIALDAKPRALSDSGIPTLLNPVVIAQALQRYYPPLLRDAGVGGEVLVWFYVNERGLVEKTRLKRSSGHEALDDAALKVAELMRFAPAMKDGQPVAAWIDLPIVFKVK